MGSDLIYGKREDVIKKVLDERTYGYNGTSKKLLDHEHIGNAIYCAVEETTSTERRVRCVIVKIEQSFHVNEWLVKVMHENEGPFFYECPMRILMLLTSNDSQWGNNWRSKCWDRLRGTV